MPWRHCGIFKDAHHGIIFRISCERLSPSQLQLLTFRKWNFLVYFHRYRYPAVFSYALVEILRGRKCASHEKQLNARASEIIFRCLITDLLSVYKPRIYNSMKDSRNENKFSPVTSITDFRLSSFISFHLISLSKNWKNIKDACGRYGNMKSGGDEGRLAQESWLKLWLNRRWFQHSLNKEIG